MDSLKRGCLRPLRIAGGGGVGGGQKDTAPRGDVDSLGDQTGSVDYGGSSKSSSSSSSSGGLLSDLGGALSAGLGIVPLGLEIANLFGGGSSTPPPLTRYAMPDSIGFTGSTDDTAALSDTDFSQTGQPRSSARPPRNNVIQRGADPKKKRRLISHSIERDARNPSSYIVGGQTGRTKRKRAR